MTERAKEWGLATLEGDPEVVCRIELSLKPDKVEVTAGWFRGLHAALVTQYKQYAASTATPPSTSTTTVTESNYKGMLALRYDSDPLRVRLVPTFKSIKEARDLVYGTLLTIAIQPLEPDGSPSSTAPVSLDSIATLRGFDLVECIAEAEVNPDEDLKLGSSIRQLTYLLASYTVDVDFFEVTLVNRLNHVHDEFKRGSLLTRSVGNPLRYTVFHTFGTPKDARHKLSSTTMRLWNREHPVDQYLATSLSVDALTLVGYGPPDFAKVKYADFKASTNTSDK